TLVSRIDPNSETFRENETAQRQLVAELHERLAKTALGGPEKSRERHLARGKLLPRDRVDQLLDNRSPFLEVAPLAANGMYDDESCGGRLSAGIWLANGKHVVVSSTGATVKAGTHRPMTGKKHLREAARALDSHIPSIYPVDSARAFLPKQDEACPDRD